jgi:hypothetical protein
LKNIKQNTNEVVLDEKHYEKICIAHHMADCSRQRLKSLSW